MVNFSAVLVGLAIGLITSFLIWMFFRPEWSKKQKIGIGILGLGLIITGLYFFL